MNYHLFRIKGKEDLEKVTGTLDTFLRDFILRLGNADGKCDPENLKTESVLAV